MLPFYRMPFRRSAPANEVTYSNITNSIFVEPNCCRTLMEWIAMRWSENFSEWKMYMMCRSDIIVALVFALIRTIIQSSSYRTSKISFCRFGSSADTVRDSRAKKRKSINPTTVDEIKSFHSNSLSSVIVSHTILTDDDLSLTCASYVCYACV